MRLLRHQLHLLVWTVPQRRVAGALGRSDTWLKLIAKSLEVPTPPPGYWSKQRQGRAPARAPLPDADRVQLTPINIAREELVRLLEEACADDATRHALLTDQRPPPSPPTGNWLSTNAPPASTTPAAAQISGADGGAGEPERGSRDARTDAGGKRGQTQHATSLGRGGPPVPLGECLLPVSSEQLQMLGDELERHQRAAHFIEAIEAQLSQQPPHTRAFLVCWVVLAREQLDALDPVQRWIGACSRAAAQGEWPPLVRLAGP